MPPYRLSLALLPFALLSACASNDEGTSAQPTFVDPDPVAPPEALPSAERPDGLAINELQTRNDSTVLSPRAELADWVELYANGPEPLDLARVTLTNGESTWTGSGTLPAGGRLVLWAGAEATQDTLPFALSGADERLELAIDGVVVDRVATGDLRGDTSLARFPDGGAWRPTARPTPGQTNGNAPSASLDPSDALFDPVTVHTFELLLSEDALASLRASPYTEVQGSLGFEGIFFRRVGVRLKGVYGSLRSVDAKAGFRIDLNQFEDHTLRGVETLTMNNMVQDYTAMHETLGYEQLRALGVPAPRTAYARVVVNGVDRGLYTLLETPDENLLARWFIDPTGALWEGEYGVDFWSGYEPYWDHDGGPEDTAVLTNVMATFDAMSWPPTDADIDALDSLVDLDQWLRVLAWEAVALHWDGYTTANNYRIYLDPADGRFALMPWGIDQIWIDYWYGPWDGYGRVFTTCIANVNCRRRYDDALIEVVDLVEAMDPVSRLEALAPLVTPELETDAYREYGMGTHLGYVQATRDTMTTWPAQVRAAAEQDRLTTR